LTPSCTIRFISSLQVGSSGALPVVCQLSIEAELAALGCGFQAVLDEDALDRISSELVTEVAECATDPGVPCWLPMSSGRIASGHAALR
jgi:hypothetical protein